MIHSIFWDALPLACLAHFINLCFTEGYIFHFWYRWIYWRLYLQSKEPLTRETYFAPNQQPGQTRWKLNLFRVLGGCADCFSVWLSIPFFVFFYGDNIYSLALWPLFVGSSYIWFYFLENAFTFLKNAGNNQSGLQPSAECKQCGQNTYQRPKPTVDPHVATVHRESVGESNHYSGA